MKPSIFISHSCKDNEQDAPAGLEAAQLQARAERLAFARKLRDELFQRLTEDGSRFEVFLDVRGGLKPGDRWRNGLHKALRACTGAVVLLSPEALESGWVLKEATILSWRVFLGEPLKVIPVMLGVSASELERRGFGALDLDAIQWIDVRDATEASRKQAVDEIVNALEQIPPGALTLDETRWRSTVERWVHELANQLRRAVGDYLVEDYLVEMCDALSIERNDRQRFDDDPFLTVAVHTLAAAPDDVLNLLFKAGDPTREQRAALHKKVRPLWVDAAAANRLPFAVTQNRVVAIDGEHTESARDYVSRAYCTHIRSDRVLVPNDVTGATLSECLSQVAECLERYLPIEDADRLREDIENNGEVFVILGPGLTRPDVLEEVTRRYRPLTFVTLAGPRPGPRLGDWRARVMLLRPDLQSGRREVDGARYRNRLDAYVEGRA